MYKEMQHLARAHGFQFWKNLKAEILKLIDRGFKQENRGSDEERQSEPLKMLYFAARVAPWLPPMSLNEMALATLG
jgi:hypothetical protein